MARPHKPRQCSCPHRASFEAIYKPAGIPLGQLECITLFRDELETLHLCDGLGKTQEEAGACMGVSRGTVQRLLSAGRRKVAEALVKQAALAVSGREKAAAEVK